MSCSIATTLETTTGAAGANHSNAVVDRERSDRDMTAGVPSVAMSTCRVTQDREFVRDRKQSYELVQLIQSLPVAHELAVWVTRQVEI